jgi:hypothetical protein
MPHGKKAGERCVQLLPDLRCALFGRPERPAFCASLRPSREMCGADAAEATARLDTLELATRPDPSPAPVFKLGPAAGQGGGRAP